MTLIARVSDLLRDPITHQPMHDPRTAPCCGNVYEKLEIEAYLNPASRRQETTRSCGYTYATDIRTVPDQCPLCAAALSVDSLRPHLLTRAAIGIVQRCITHQIVEDAQLDPAEKNLLERIEHAILQHRERNRAMNIPYRLSQPLPSVRTIAPVQP